MALQHVDVADRATVVMALTAHRQGLEIAKRESGPIQLIGARVQNLKQEMKRADRMIEAFTNKWIYLSDDVLDISKLYLPDVVNTPPWATALREMYQLIANAVIFVHDETGKPTTPLTVDDAATQKLKGLIYELTAGGTL